MYASFWESKRAQMQAERDAKLAELAEFQAREEALYSAVAEPATAIAPSTSGDVAALTAEASALNEQQQQQRRRR